MTPPPTHKRRVNDRIIYERPTEADGIDEIQKIAADLSAKLDLKAQKLKELTDYQLSKQGRK